MKVLGAATGGHPFPMSHAIETYKSLIALSMLGLRSIILSNAGGMVAVLICVAHMPVARGAFPFIFMIYLFGMFCSLLALFVSYLTQLRLFNESRQSIYGNAVIEFHVLYMNAGLVLTILAILSFAGGSAGIAFMLNNWS